MSRTDRERDMAERFQKDTAAHEMTVRHDDEGMYRHLRFSAPNSLDWIDLLTWPYNLIANGSHGSFHFCRFGPDTEDMFALFRDGGAGNRINPSYWAEKLRAGEVKSWSEEKFRAWLVDEAAALGEVHPGIVEAVSARILHSDEHSVEHEETARYALNDFSHEGGRIRFPEPWEVSFEDFDWKYLWSCHGIAWGIAQYDALNAPTPLLVPAEQSSPQGSGGQP